MRPRGEVRAALAAALARLHCERGPVSPREVAEAANVGYGLAAMTLRNMARAGDAVLAGTHKPQGRRWHRLYEPAPPDAKPQRPLPWGGIEALACAMRGFVPHGAVEG